jgi:hypothetical protein
MGQEDEVNVLNENIHVFDTVVSAEGEVSDVLG